MTVTFDEAQDKLPSVVVVEEGPPIKASKGGSQVGPVLLPVVPVGLRLGTQPEWKRPLEALCSIRCGRSSPKAHRPNGLSQRHSCSHGQQRTSLRLRVRLKLD